MIGGPFAVAQQNYNGANMLIDEPNRPSHAHRPIFLFISKKVIKFQRITKAEQNFKIYSNWNFFFPVIQSKTGKNFPGFKIFKSAAKKKKEKKKRETINFFSGFNFIR